jgi:predicted nucleotidyltransferase
VQGGSLLRLLRSLADAEVEYTIIGGIAMNLHGLVRATEDVDLMLNPSAANVHRLRTALKSMYDDPDIALIMASDLEGAYPVIRYVPPDDEPPIDLIARLGAVFSYEDVDWQELDVAGVKVRVATPESLYAMKRGTVRPRDSDDARRLARAFGLPRRHDAGED